MNAVFYRVQLSRQKKLKQKNLTDAGVINISTRIVVLNFLINIKYEFVFDTKIAFDITTNWEWREVVFNIKRRYANIGQRILLWKRSLEMEDAREKKNDAIIASCRVQRQAEKTTLGDKDVRKMMNTPGTRGTNEPHMTTQIEALS